MSKSKNIIITILAVCVVFLLVVVAFFIGREVSNRQLRPDLVTGSKRPIINDKKQSDNQETVKTEQSQIKDPGFGECKNCGFRGAVERGTLKCPKCNSYLFSSWGKASDEQERKEAEQRAKDEQERMEAQNELQQQKDLVAIQIDQQRRAMAGNAILGIMSNMQQQQNTQQLIYEQRRPKRTTGTVTPNYIGGYDYDGTTR